VAIFSLSQLTVTNTLQLISTSMLKSKIVGLAVLIAFGAATSAQANPKYAGIVIDAKTGKTLYKYNADSKRYPASLTKMMTLYLVFEALERGKIKKSSRIRVSKNAAAEQPSKLGLRVGSTISVEQAIYALVTKSANDVATATGEFLGGSEARFAKLMTEKAHSLRMKSTTFKNAHGLPNSRQVTTARDMARLGLALREHYPQYYRYFSTRSFKFGKATYGNHNRLLGKVRGVDGIKTGYTRASGFNLVSSVQTGGRSIVAVVMGGKSGASRNAQMQKLVSQYLGKASKRGRGNLMVKKRLNGLAPNIQVASKLPKNVPVPVIRSNSAPTVVASAYAPVPKAKPARTAAAVAVSKLPVPQTNDGVDPVKTASINLPKGWVVQVGASDTETKAKLLLAKAKKVGGKSIQQAQQFTMAFEKDGQQYYRARFAGFSGQSQAVAACKFLKKRGVGCWAAAQ
jgi:D-alanyl-D-alanine carboxypeptidase